MRELVCGAELSTGDAGSGRSVHVGDGSGRSVHVGYGLESSAHAGYGLDRPVQVGYVSGPGPRVTDVVTGLRRRGVRRIAIAAYLLADGLFYRGLGQAGADHVTPPLGLDPAVADLALSRYDAALLTTAPARL